MLVITTMDYRHMSKYLYDFDRTDNYYKVMMQFDYDPTPQMSQYLVSITTKSFTVLFQVNKMKAAMSFSSRISKMRQKIKIMIKIMMMLIMLKLLPLVVVVVMVMVTTMMV